MKKRNKQRTVYRLWKRSISMVRYDTDNGRVRYAFHGATTAMLTHVFRLLKRKIFKDYEIQKADIEMIRNGRLQRTTFVNIIDPIPHHIAQKEWPEMIKHVMERMFHCRVNYFNNYEKFLNT